MTSSLCHHASLFFVVTSLYWPLITILEGSRYRFSGERTLFVLILVLTLILRYAQFTQNLTLLFSGTPSTPKDILSQSYLVTNNNNNDNAGPAFFGSKNLALISIFGRLRSIYHSRCTKARETRSGA
jgi:hypothetical protein